MVTFLPVRSWCSLSPVVIFLPQNNYSKRNRFACFAKKKAEN
jgi:hypothetical protein